MISEMDTVPGTALSVPRVQASCTQGAVTAPSHSRGQLRGKSLVTRLQVSEPRMLAPVCPLAARLCRRGSRVRLHGAKGSAAVGLAQRPATSPSPDQARTTPRVLEARGLPGKRRRLLRTRAFVSAKGHTRRAELPYDTWALRSLYFPSNIFPSPTGPGRSFLGPRRALPHPDHTCTSWSFLFPPRRLFPGCGLLTSAHGKAALGQSRLTVSLLVRACDLGHCLLSPCRPQAQLHAVEPRGIQSGRQ